MKNEKIMNIIDKSIKTHNTKNSLMLERYVNYYELPICNNYVLYESFCGQGIIDNPYALFKSFMKRKDFCDYVHIWVVDNFEEKWFQILEYSSYSNIRYVKYGSDEYLRYLCVSKYLINNCTFPTYFTKKDNQIYINTWHGITIKKLGYDVPDSRLTMGNTIRNFLSTDYIISANAEMTNVYRYGYKLDTIYNGTIIEEGHPRMDLCQVDKKYVFDKLESFGVNIDKTKRIILYAPTWSGTLSSPNQVDYKKVLDLVDTSKYQILYKPHHVNYKQGNVPSAMDTNELLSICDVIITDYSSIAYDFMSLNKPVIFYMPDYDEYIKEHGLYTMWNCNIAYDLNILKVYLDHIEDLTIIHNCYMPSADKILSIILDNSIGNRIKFNTNKIKLLFYVGDFKPNGVTTSFMSLSESIDYDKFDVSLIVLNKKDELYKKFINSLNPNIRVLCRAGTYSQTLLEECAKDITLDQGIGTEYLDNLLPKEMYRREFRRCFGITKFDKLINFTGYSPFYSYLFISAEGEKIIWQHNDMIQDMNRNINGKKPLYTPLSVVFSTYKYYDRLVSASEEIMKINLRSFQDIPIDKFYYAHNTLDYKKIIKLSNEYNGIDIDKSKINFVNNGRLSPAKNQENLIKAFNKFSSKHTNCELYIVGDGELKDHLKSIANEHVHIIGYQENPYYIMKQCDYFIFPSIYEGQGIALLEARVLGLPIIVSDLPKMKGIFINNDQLNINGFGEKNILYGLEECYKGNVKSYSFDFEKYNEESYKEFEVSICE